MSAFKIFVPWYSAVIWYYKVGSNLVCPQYFSLLTGIPKLCGRSSSEKWLSLHLSEEYCSHRFLFFPPGKSKALNLSSDLFVYSTLLICLHFYLLSLFRLLCFQFVSEFLTLMLRVKEGKFWILDAYRVKRSEFSPCGSAYLLAVLWSIGSDEWILNINVC